MSVSNWRKAGLLRFTESGDLDQDGTDQSLRDACKGLYHPRRTPALESADEGLSLGEAKRRHGIHYVPFVHDFIPVMAPQHCVRELTQDFLSWTFGVFDHADFFLVNSLATRADLLRVADRLGYKVSVDNIEVIPLDYECVELGGGGIHCSTAPIARDPL